MGRAILLGLCVEASALASADERAAEAKALFDEGDIRPAAVLSDSIVVPGQKVALTGELRRGSRPVEGVALTLDLPPGWRLAEGPGGPTGGDAAHQTAVHLRLGDEARPAIPRRTAQYETLNGTERPVVHFRYSLSGHQLTARCAPGLVIAPPQVVNIEPHVLWFRRSLVGGGDGCATA